MLTYVDASVVLSEVLAETGAPGPAFWDRRLVSSRLLQYEVWTRVHARGRATTHSESVRALLDRIDLVELSPPALARALEPFPISLRTLDALHLATVEYLRSHERPVELATHDRRLREAARGMKIPLYRL